MVNRVGNLPESVEWKPGSALFSAWVCEKRACVLDAMGWVERNAGTPAYVVGPLASLGAEQ